MTTTSALTCSVYLARLAQLAAWHSELLSPPERDRAAKFRQAADRDRFVLATAMVRTTAGEFLGCRPVDVPLNRTCEHCGGPHGRPRLPGTGLEASISHSGDVAAVALTEGQPVGVDVEVIGSRDYAPLLARVCTDAERLRVRTASDFYTIWSRKEAVLKATGQGLRTPMTRLTVTPPGRPAAVLSLAGSALACQLADVAAGEGYAAAAAVLTETEVIFEVRAAAALLAS